MRRLVNASGSAVHLGPRLGRGGEGDVFEVVGQPNVVAKLYHRMPSAEKQSKLMSMVATDSESLLACIAWPITTLHERPKGPVMGFLMPRVCGEPIHKLYSPAHRKHIYPAADWAFLVHVARNVAAAFVAVHAAGHVVADVNQGNVVVAPDGRVRLIDCDSFQIVSRGRAFLCDVGVQHFTPPELQSAKSFRGIRRTENHDNFGLAVLCFHLLFMGRHPFSGVYNGKGDMPIEQAIKEYRFAFSTSGANRGMSPPPCSVSLSIVPQQIAALFERAFSEDGARSRRPTASHWAGMLDYLRGNLCRCPIEPIHKFFGGVGACPWCGLDSVSGAVFFVGAPAATTEASVFRLDAVWRRITAIEPPKVPPLRPPSSIRVFPRPLPPGHTAHPAMNLLKRIAAALLSTSFADSEEKVRRRMAVTAATKQWEVAQRQWIMETGDTRFRSRLSELERIRRDYEKLNADYTVERQELHKTIRVRQMHRFLDGIYIEPYEIPNIGPVRQAALASFGIETAADVAESKVRAIQGFGDVLTRHLLDWRRQQERRFVFDPSKGVDPADVAAVDRRYRQKQMQLEGELLAGAESLSRLREEAFARARALRPHVEHAARCLAQAEADLSIA